MTPTAVPLTRRHSLMALFGSIITLPVIQSTIALAAGPKTMAAALKAGATIVLPRSTPPATLAKIIQRLAKKR